MSEKATALSLGGGVNSTGVLCGIAESHPELRPDVILFADVGAENPKTYAHVRALDEWLAANKMPLVTWVREGRFTLEEECLSAKTLPSIVTGMRSCSDKFKIRPQNRWMKEHYPNTHVVKLVGFDAGEPWRAKDYSTDKVTVRFPLIEWGWARAECVAAIERAGLTVPPKSSCFFCPEMEEMEIVDLALNNPDLADRAVAMERNARNGKLVTIAGLARTHSWESVIEFHRNQERIDGTTLLPKREKRLPCICSDGDE